MRMGHEGGRRRSLFCWLRNCGPCILVDRKPSWTHPTSTRTSPRKSQHWLRLIAEWSIPSTKKSSVVSPTRTTPSWLPSSASFDGSRSSPCRFVTSSISNAILKTNVENSLSKTYTKLQKLRTRVRGQNFIQTSFFPYFLLLYQIATATVLLGMEVRLLLSMFVLDFFIMLDCPECQEAENTLFWSVHGKMYLIKAASWAVLVCVCVCVCVCVRERGEGGGSGDQHWNDCHPGSRGLADTFHFPCNWRSRKESYGLSICMRVLRNTPQTRI